MYDICKTPPHTIKVHLKMQKCKNLYVGTAQTKFRTRLNYYKGAQKSFKTKK